MFWSDWTAFVDKLTITIWIFIKLLPLNSLRDRSNPVQSRPKIFDSSQYLQFYFLWEHEVVDQRHPVLGTLQVLLMCQSRPQNIAANWLCPPSWEYKESVRVENLVGLGSLVEIGRSEAGKVYTAQLKVKVGGLTVDDRYKTKRTFFCLKTV